MSGGDRDPRLDPVSTRPTAPAPAVTDPVQGRRRRFPRVGRVLPVAVVQVLGTLLAARITQGDAAGGPPWARHDPGAHPLDPVTLGPLAIVMLVAGVLVLPWRWRWPRAVLLVTLASTVAYAAVVTPRGPFVAALTMALANAWLRGHRRWVVAAAAIAVVVLPSADVLLGRSSTVDLQAVLLAIAWATVTIAVSELVRVRVERVAERRRQRAEAERRRAADERVRIARELHDSVAHSMSLINLQAGVALHLGQDLPEQTRDALGNIRDSSREALVELRAILGVLRAVDGTDGAGERTPTAGLARVADLIERARAAGVDVRASVHGDLSTVTGITDRNAFRIVQESVTNVMKHAPDHRAEVTVRVDQGIVDLVVEDHPVPTAAPPHVPADQDTTPTALLGPSGNGLIGMRERANAVGGDVRAAPTTDGGWRVAARLPVVTTTSGTTDASGSAATTPETATPATRLTTATQPTTAAQPTTAPTPTTTTEDTP